MLGNKSKQESPLDILGKEWDKDYNNAREGAEKETEKRKKGPYRIITQAALVFLVLFGIWAFFSSAFQVREGQYALVKKWGTQFSRTIEEPGLYFKNPFIDQVEYLSKASEIYEIFPSEVLTKDKKKMLIELYIVWNIKEPETFKRSLQTVPEAHQRMELSAYNVTKTVFSTLNQADVIGIKGSGRETLNTRILEGTKAHNKDYGLDITDVRVKGIQLPETNMQSVYARMISERNAISAEIEAAGKLEASKITNQTNSDVTKILSEANTEANTLLVNAEETYLKTMEEAYSTAERKQFFQFLRELEALEANIQSTTTIILGKDSALAELLQ